jgi:hypothetical protein
LNRTLEELRWYPDVLPLSDLLHLGKLQGSVLEARAHVCLRWCQRLNQSRQGSCNSRFGDSLTDLSQVGKMRDADPLVLTGIENNLQLIEQNAFPEAVTLLPLSLCFNAMCLKTNIRETRIDLL